MTLRERIKDAFYDYMEIAGGKMDRFLVKTLPDFLERSSPKIVRPISLIVLKTKQTYASVLEYIFGTERFSSKYEGVDQSYGNPDTVISVLKRLLYYARAYSPFGRDLSEAGYYSIFCNMEFVDSKDGLFISFNKSNRVSHSAFRNHEFNMLERTICDVVANKHGDKIMKISSKASNEDLMLLNTIFTAHKELLAQDQFYVILEIILNEHDARRHSEAQGEIHY